MKKTKLLKGLTIFSCMTITALVISGCTTKPFNERYERIHEITEAVDYSAVGEILYEGYAPNKGYVTSAYFDVIYKDSSSYKELYKRVTAVPGVECEDFNGTGVYCEKGIVTIGIGLMTSPREGSERWGEIQTPYVYFSITDSNNGEANK